MEKDVERFAVLEKNMALFERKYKGFAYWQYLRFGVCEALFGERHEIEKKVSGKIQINFSKRLLFAVTDILKDIRFFLLQSRCDLAVFRQAVLKDKFFDFWQMPEEIKTYSFRAEENINEYLIGEHYFGFPRIKKGLYFRLYKVLKKKIFQTSSWNVFDTNERKFLVELEDRLKEQYGQSLSWQEMEEAVIDASITHNIYKKYFKKVFDKLQCKAILTIVYYQTVLYPAYEAAREKGIKIIELQHGVINNHESYWFEDRRGINNYTPDYLLTYGDIHNEWIKLVTDSRAVSVGFPYQEYMISTLKDIETKSDTVIFYPDSFPEYEDIIDQYIKKYRQYNVLIKLHPLQSGHIEEYFPVLSKNKDAVFINSQDKGIYYWLKYAKHHVMASTTVGLEAMAYDHCNVCIIESVPHEQTQCLLDWGVARGFRTVDELADLIQNPIEDKPNIQDVRGMLWKRDAKKNMEEFFQKMFEDGWV